jgi:hypothetical protein
MEKIAERIACAVVAGLVGLFVCFALWIWITPALILFIVIPLACALIGFAAGDRAVEAVKRIAEWI